MAVLLIFSTSACASDEKINIGKEQVSLNLEQCVIKLSSSKIMQLEMKPSCYFIKESNAGRIRKEYFEDIKSNVLVVVGTSVKGNKDFPLTQTRYDCGSELQAIIFPDKGEPKLSKVISDTISCAGTGIDKKEYWIISH